MRACNSRTTGREIYYSLEFEKMKEMLAVLPDTTHVTLMNRMSTIVPMVNDFSCEASKAVINGTGLQSHCPRKHDLSSGVWVHPQSPLA